jgi:hypothetical protein
MNPKAEEILEKWLYGRDYTWTDGGCLTVNDNADGFLKLISLTRESALEEAAMWIDERTSDLDGTHRKLVREIRALKESKP